MQALDWSGRKEMGSPAKGERGQQQGFPEKVGLEWGGGGGRQFQGYAGAKAGVGSWGGRGRWREFKQSCRELCGCRLSLGLN